MTLVVEAPKQQAPRVRTYAEITPARVLALMEDAVVSRGTEWKYLPRHCQYVNYLPEFGFGPACIVGECLSREGVTLTELQDMDRRMGPFDGVLFNEMFQNRFYVGSLATRMLRAAQMVQDGRGTWGEAYNRAMAVYLQMEQH